VDIPTFGFHAVETETSFTLRPVGSSFIFLPVGCLPSNQARHLRSAIIMIHNYRGDRHIRAPLVVHVVEDGLTLVEGVDSNGLGASNEHQRVGGHTYI
jgi:hypothetical protein